jgi:predicted alpha/beta-fold hydrolase
VLSFDSIFRDDVSKRSRHGVAGNLKAEAEVAIRIIERFLNQEDVKGRVSKIALVGTSYGGSVALNIMLQPKAFSTSRVLVFSPPVRMQTAAARLDAMRPALQKFGTGDLLKMRGHERVEPGAPPPFSDDLMQAGVAYVFRKELAKVVERMDELYDLNRMGEESGKEWTFMEFVQNMCWPYWSQHGVSSIEELWDHGDLFKLLPQVEDNVQVILTDDDPLNDPLELVSLQSRFAAPKLLVLQNGGHLGYAGNDWVADRLARLFE